MNTLAGFLLFTASCLPILYAVPSVAQDVGPEDEVRAAVERFGKAYRDADVGTLRGMLTPEYVHVNGSSGNRMDRDQWLSWVASQRHLLDEGQLRIDVYEISDIQIHLYANVAVVTGTVRSEGMRSGQPLRTHVRFTNVWIEDDGTWRRAAFHDSPIPESDD